jgi:RNA polymerase sigma-70 factor, ECF subfamily
MGETDVTLLLEHISAGDERAGHELVAAVYKELRRMAASFLRHEREDHTLQPTALVHEAYMELVRGEPRWENRAHFFGAAARAMRQILVSNAREHAAQKRGGDALRVTLEDVAVGQSTPEPDILALDEALQALGGFEERLCRVVELRYFAGCSLEEIAQLTGRSVATVKRDWIYARAWLYEYMTRR